MLPMVSSVKNPEERLFFHRTAEIFQNRESKEKKKKQKATRMANPIIIRPKMVMRAKMLQGQN